MGTYFELTYRLVVRFAHLSSLPSAKFKQCSRLLLSVSFFLALVSCSKSIHYLYLSIFVGALVYFCYTVAVYFLFISILNKNIFNDPLLLISINYTLEYILHVLAKS